MTAGSREEKIISVNEMDAHLRDGWTVIQVIPDPDNPNDLKIVVARREWTLDQSLRVGQIAGTTQQMADLAEALRESRHIWRGDIEFLESVAQLAESLSVNGEAGW